MIIRTLEKNLIGAINAVPVVALLGPRQVGKTTLALDLVHKKIGKKIHYMDLELDSDLARLEDPETYLRQFSDTLLIIDEVQRKPDLFRVLRGLVDYRKRQGETSGQFLLLGSASRDLLQHSSETLAGRIRYLELTSFLIKEIRHTEGLGFNPDKLWFRGGFPNSYLAPNDEESWLWRGDFIATYVERDIPLMGPKVAASQIKRFWQMLAHYHGQQINLSGIGKSLESNHTTIRNYLDILTDFYMVRQIQPWSGNTKKRLVKSPKIYLRDTGLLHRLLNLSSFDDLLGHPHCGASWEGFLIENIINSLSDKWRYSYYRTASQTEIDLVLEGPRQETWAVEIKRSVAPKVSAGFHKAAEDIGATKKFVVYGGQEQFPLSHDTQAIGITDFLEVISNLS